MCSVRCVYAMSPHLFPRLLWGPCRLRVTSGQASCRWLCHYWPSFWPQLLSQWNLSPEPRRQGKALTLSASILRFLFPSVSFNIPSSRSWSHFINNPPHLFLLDQVGGKKDASGFYLNLEHCGAPSWGKVHLLDELISRLNKLQMKNIIMDAILSSHKTWILTSKNKPTCPVQHLTQEVRLLRKSVGDIY